MSEINYNRLTRSQIADAVKDHKAFKNSTGSMRGVVLPIHVTLGDLNQSERDTLRVDLQDSGITYLIYSYETPIAWVRKDGTVHKVNQTFSQTTSCHQGRLYYL